MFYSERSGFAKAKVTGSAPSPQSLRASSSRAEEQFKFTPVGRDQQNESMG